MNKKQFKLITPLARQLAAKAVSDAPDGYVAEVKPATRTLDQNAKLWAMLSDISKQVDWHGNKLNNEEWKHVFTAALSKQKVVPGIDGGFVVLGQSTSRMNKKDFAEMIELILAFGHEQGVKFSDIAKEYVDYDRTT